MNSNGERFINKYKELEKLVSTSFDLPKNISPIPFLAGRTEYLAIKNDLDYCREVRNLLSHRPMIKGRYAVEPSDEMIELLDQTIERIRHPKQARHILIPKEKVSCRTMDDYVLPAMQEMNDRVYTHIPIVHDGIVVGVFSENTLLSYLIDEEIVCIDRSIKFRDIEKYLPLENHKAESFRFVRQNMLVSEIETIFAEAVKKSDRIGMIFVTHTGKPTEKMLGIISAWDVAGIT